MVTQDLASGQPSAVLRHRNICVLIRNLDERGEDLLEIFPRRAGQRVGHVLPDTESGILVIGGISHLLDDSYSLEEEGGLSTQQPRLVARDTQVLARAAEGDDVYRLDVSAMDGMHIA